MAEHISELSFNPYDNYSRENYPPVKEQSEFFRHALLEVDESTETSRIVKGAFYDSFIELMEATNQQLATVNSSFRPEHLMPYGYQSQEVRKEVGSATLSERKELLRIQNWRASETARLANQVIIPLSQEQTLPPPVLDTPPYCRQQEDWNGSEGMKGCTNACFRMVFGAITGWTPSQAATSRSLIDRYGTSVVDDEIYCKIFSTDVFREICDRDIMSFEMIGADFKSISTIVEKIKMRRSGAEVYCLVNLASKRAEKAVWHTNILLGSDSEKVVCHDPSNVGGGESISLPREQFMNRWAVAYNRARFIVAA